jgi:3-methyl-2-oxobutanoate hydroxymethyltransferase
MRLTLTDLAAMKSRGEKLAMLTCYDASFAAACDDAGVDILLIGDSLGNVIQGHDTTLPVTLEHAVYHTACVVRGAKRAFIVTDLPFGTYQLSREQAFESAVKAMAAGAQMVKLEGGEAMAETVRFLVERGIPVCGHVGLTPQSVHQLGGFRVQGKSADAAQRLIDDAKLLEDAGASLVVLEAIPSALAARVTAALGIATIGIGAGVECSGQVLVIYDMLDVFPGKKPRFVRNFMSGADSIRGAIKRYVDAVKSGEFPAPEHGFS